MDDARIDTLLRSGDETTPAELREAVLATVAERSSTMATDREPLRRRGLVAVSVAAALVVLLAGLITIGDPRDGRPPTDTAPSEPTTTTRTSMEPTDPVTASVSDFLTALNSRDVAAALDLVAPGAPIVVSPVTADEAGAGDITLADQVAWLDAWGWRWNDVSCDVERGDAVDAVATCVAEARTKLGDIDGVVGASSFEVRLLDTTITSLTWGTEFPGWIPSFDTFRSWAERIEPGWEPTVEAPDVDRALLDEYVGLMIPPTIQPTERTRTIPDSNPDTLEPRADRVWIIADDLPDDLVAFRAFGNGEGGFVTTFATDGCEIGPRRFTWGYWASDLTYDTDDQGNETCDREVVINSTEYRLALDETVIPDAYQMDKEVSFTGLTKAEQDAVMQSLRAVVETDLPHAPFVGLSQYVRGIWEAAVVVAIDPDNGSELRASSDGSSMVQLVADPGANGRVFRTTADRPIVFEFDKTNTAGGQIYGMTEPEVADLVMSFDDDSIVVIPTQDVSGLFRNQFFTAWIPSDSGGDNWRTITARDANGDTLAVYDAECGRMCGIETILVDQDGFSG